MKSAFVRRYHTETGIFTNDRRFNRHWRSASPSNVRRQHVCWRGWISHNRHAGQSIVHGQRPVPFSAHIVAATNVSWNRNGCQCAICDILAVKHEL